EVDLLGDLDLLLRHDDKGGLLRAAGFIPAGWPGLHRTLVIDVEHRVLVVIGLGATVGVLVAVGILGIVHARLARRILVVDVDNRVEVIVEFRAAVLVEVAVLVLGVQDAAVLGVGDAIAVGVGIVGAAVFVLVALEVLRIVRALVVGIEITVAVSIADRSLF